MPLPPGTPAPWFHGRTHHRPDYSFSSLGGHYVLLAFLPDDGAEAEAAAARLHAARALFDGRQRVAFGVVRDAGLFERLEPDLPGLRWFLDDDGRIAGLFDLLDADGRTQGQWMVLDPTLRVLATFPLDQDARAFALLETVGPPEDHAGVALHAPVLIAPRIFEPAFCRRLIDYYDNRGGEASGVMRDVDGRTRQVFDDFKKRRDALIEDESLRAEARARIQARLIPEMAKALQFAATRMERYIVACYDADDGGYFRPHRDNTTRGTAHRKFACSINLNADEFEGGDLRFPEFGRRTYRPQTGGAVIFSCSLLHEVTPVTAGTRYAFLPFFYDEAGAKLRQENLRYLEGAADVGA